MKEIGDIEALEYYKKIASKIFLQEESKCLSKYEGFIEEDISETINRLEKRLEEVER